MAKITRFPREKVLLKQAEDAYNKVNEAGIGIEDSMRRTLIDLVELPPWRIISITLSLIRVLVLSRRLRKLAIYRESICNMGYTLGYIKCRNERKRKEKK